jgi:hypothetical protein
MLQYVIISIIVLVIFLVIYSNTNKQNEKFIEKITHESGTQNAINYFTSLNKETLKELIYFTQNGADNSVPDCIVDNYNNKKKDSYMPFFNYISMDDYLKDIINKCKIETDFDLIDGKPFYKELIYSLLCNYNNGLSDTEKQNDIISEYLNNNSFIQCNNII